MLRLLGFLTHRHGHDGHRVHVTCLSYRSRQLVADGGRDHTTGVLGATRGVAGGGKKTEDRGGPVLGEVFLNGLEGFCFE